MTRKQAVLAALLAAGAGACARALPPPGGEPDTDPPRILSTTPENLAVVPAFRGPIVFRFDETISERGFSNNLVVVSPEQGTPTVNRDGSELRVRLEGGWQPNRVYRVVVLSGLQDRRGNQRRVPTELVFSTGDSILPTAIAGLVTDRITRKPVPNARVHAISPDSIVHVAITDTSGFFALRFIPMATYTIQAFEDRNRNRRMDPVEPQATASVTLTSAQDTQVVTLELLARDTLPARLASAVGRDSVHAVLTFDDYLDPEQPLGDARASVYQLPDSTPVTGHRLLYPHQYEAYRAAQAAAADTTRRTPPVAQPDTTPLPTRELILLFERPLPPETRFRVNVTNITNISGAPGGGGSAVFTTPAPMPAPDTIRRDTAALPGPTAARGRRR